MILNSKNNVFQYKNTVPLNNVELQEFQIYSHSYSPVFRRFVIGNVKNKGT